MNYPHPIIAREGWFFLLIAFGLSACVQFFFGFWWALPLWIIAFFVLQFFRDPPRALPLAEGVVLSPADGRVVVVERCIDPFVEREAIKISVFMNVFNVHSNRVPVDGRVEQLNYFPGKFFNADLDKASLNNERNAMVLRTDTGEKVTVVQVAGLIARRILCYVRVGDQLQRGQRYGFIRFGSRVDLYLPVHARPLVTIGEKVYATRSTLAAF
ncbi:MAG: phosphatidylserine decarboxylase [Ottowia sp.]|nr:phosphatidylserine decarboxylase [Ottowia sp.]